MLIANDEQRLRAGIASLSKRCSYCTKALAAYPLIMSDDARFQVYHAGCAAALATEILVDLYTFFIRRRPLPRCMFSPPSRQFLVHEEGLCSQRIWKRSKPPSLSRRIIRVPG